MMDEKLILLAEDSEAIRQFLEESVLRPAGFRVQAVGDGIAALAFAHNLMPQLVITDHNMPSLSGLELAERLQRDLPQIPVILMTSEASKDLMLEALRAGAVDFLTKPFEAEQLLAAVGRALKLKRPARSSSPSFQDTRPTNGRLARRVKELEALARIGREVTSVLDLDQVLTTVVEESVRLTGAEEGSLLLLEPESGELYMRASKNFDDEFARTFRLQVRDSLAGSVLERGEPVLLDETSPQKIKTAYLVHSLIYVPLRMQGRVIGVLGVDNRKAGRALNSEDVKLLTSMADFAAIAIENAQLFNRSDDQRRKLETILTQSESGLIVVDNENRMLLINPTARAIFGIEGECEGLPAVEVFDEPQLLSMLRGEGPLSQHDEITFDDGRVFSTSCTPIRGVGQTVILHDISHLKELDRIKSEFVTTVSHDLRSPLTAILGYVELIDRAGPLTPEQVDFLNRVRLSVEQITDLVTDLLDLGRIESGLDTTKEETQLAVLAHYAVQGLKSEADVKGVRLATSIAGDLPLLHGDPIRLRQMIGNLLSNAIKYTPAGGEVRLETEVEDQQLILRVRDTGMGIPASDQPFLFDKFFRASNVPLESAGTGLGLSIVKSIVEQHKGRIWVESREGVGTTFTIVIPSLPD
jgi:signal transduction histidine kinase/CheY-like chemotaxis protein